MLNSLNILGRQKIRQCAYFLFTLSLFTHAFAQNLITRKPANYAPDEDTIIVPIEVRKESFLDEIHQKNKKSFERQRFQMEQWQINEQNAAMYGMENRPVAGVVNQATKRQYVERNYLRFVNRHFQKETEEVVREWTTDDEIQSIEQVEINEVKVAQEAKAQGRQVIEKKEEVKIAGSKVKFNMTPVVELGLVKMRMETPYFNVRAWVGVASGTELKIDRRFRATKTYASANYFLEQKRMIAYVDQDIANHWGLRFTHTRQELERAPSSIQTNTIQIRYSIGF